MTSIDFYILTSDIYIDYLNFIGKLTEKAYSKGHEIYIHTNSEKLMLKIDETLWSYRENSFLPHYHEKFQNDELKTFHKQEKENSKIKNRILVGCSGNPLEYHDILINLSDETPNFFSRFNRLSEIVIKNDIALENSRKRYKYYKDRGYPINVHNL